MSDEKIGTLLRQLRLEHNLTQAYLGKLLGKDQTYYSRLETGQKEIKLIEAKLLAEVYKIDLNIFYASDGLADVIGAPVHLLAAEGTLDISLMEHLDHCMQSKQYLKLFRAYIQLCQQYGLAKDVLK